MPSSTSSIPTGLATQLGIAGFLAYLVIGLLVQFVPGFDLDDDTMKILAAGLAPLVATQLGRYAQAYAKYRDAPGTESGLVEGDDEKVAAELDTDESVSPPTAANPDVPRGGTSGPLK